jgi:hypothetical protein
MHTSSIKNSSKKHAGSDKNAVRWQAERSELEERRRSLQEAEERCRHLNEHKKPTRPDGPGSAGQLECSE